MILYSLLFSTFFAQQCFCHPAGENLKLPKLDLTSPYEINNLDNSEVERIPRYVNSDLSSTNNIESTVKEVEALLKANPSLPRLTRGEILDILENITVTDQIKLNKSREDGKRALMVVMPFTPQKSDEDGMVELYTKKPVTHIVGGEPFKNKETKEERKTIRRRKPVSSTKLPTSEASTESSTIPDITPEPLPLISLFPDIKVIETETQHKSETVEVNTDTKPFLAQRKTINRRRRPELTSPSSIAAEDVTTTPSTTTTSTSPPVTTYKPRSSIKQRKPVRRRTTTTSAPSSSTPRFTNHKYPDDEAFIPSKSGMVIVDPPKLSSFDGYPLVAQETKEITRKKPIKQNAKPIVDQINIPNDFKSVMKDLNLDEAIKEIPNSKYSSQYAATDNRFAQSENFKDYLSQVGVFIAPTTSTTTTTSLPDVSNVADSLSPDMRELLMSFGLIPDPKSNKDVGKSRNNYGNVEAVGNFKEHADISPDSYVSFKPLPDSAPTRDDMEAFFASYGLGRSARKQKALKEEKKNETGGFNFDVVPDEYKHVLTDIGLTERDSRKIRTATINKTIEKQHVFNPSDAEYASQDELEKLNKLLEMIKELEKLNGTATDEDLKKIDLESLKELVGSLNNDKFVPLDEQNNAPNPLNYDYGINKNEVKRQESTSTTTEEPKTPSLKDLEDSFGGSSDTTPSESPPPETTTVSKRTGFYYLVDWNTFLDIDNQKGKRVNLRFQPTIGDPKRFLSVSVP